MKIKLLGNFHKLGYGDQNTASYEDSKAKQ